MKKTSQDSKRVAPSVPAPRRRSDGGDAFFPDPGEGPARTVDPLAQELAEEFLESATTAEAIGPARRDEQVAEEEGGPFVISKGSREFASGVDASNPEDAEPEPLPSPMRGVR